MLQEAKLWQKSVARLCVILKCYYVDLIISCCVVQFLNTFYRDVLLRCIERTDFLYKVIFLVIFLKINNLTY